MLAQSNFSQAVLQIAHKASDKPEAPLEKQVEHVLDLIKEKLPILAIEQTAHDVRKQVLALRKSFIDLFAQNEVSAQQHSNEVQAYVTETKKTKSNSVLANEVAEVLSAKDKILASITENAGFDQFGHLPLAALQEFKLPKFSNEAIRIWVEKSIDLEFSLIAADLALSGDLKLKKDKITELITFMDETISSYGAHTMLLGLWTRNEDDRSRLSWNMEILSRVLKLDYNRGYRLDQDGKRVMIEVWN